MAETVSDTVRLTKARRYSVTVDGFDPVMYVAPSAGAARYRAFKAWREAGYGRHRTFRDFLERTTTLHLGAALESNSHE